MGTATERRFSQAQHAPADGIPIAAVPRRPIIALHRVLSNKFEKHSILSFEGEGNLELLRGGGVCKSYAAAVTAHRIGLSEAFAICGLMATVVARELAVNVGDHSCLRSAGKIVSWNNLVAENGENAGVAVAEEIPRGAAFVVTTDDRRRAAESTREGKLPPG